MKKLTDEQLAKIASEIFYEMIPDYNDEDKESLKSLIVNVILNAIVKFISKYQNEQGD